VKKLTKESHRIDFTREFTSPLFKKKSRRSERKAQSAAYVKSENEVMEENGIWSDGIRSWSQRNLTSSQTRSLTGFHICWFCNMISFQT
jgi:hypothetical protein